MRQTGEVCMFEPGAAMQDDDETVAGQQRAASKAVAESYAMPLARVLLQMGVIWMERCGQQAVEGVGRVMVAEPPI